MVTPIRSNTEIIAETPLSKKNGKYYYGKTEITRADYTEVRQQYIDRARAIEQSQAKAIDIKPTTSREFQEATFKKMGYDVTPSDTGLTITKGDVKTTITGSGNIIKTPISAKVYPEFLPVLKKQVELKQPAPPKDPLSGVSLKVSPKLTTQKEEQIAQSVLTLEAAKQTLPVSKGFEQLMAKTTKELRQELERPVETKVITGGGSLLVTGTVLPEKKELSFEPTKIKSETFATLFKGEKDITPLPIVEKKDPLAKITMKILPELSEEKLEAFYETPLVKKLTAYPEFEKGLIKGVYTSIREEPGEIILKTGLVTAGAVALSATGVGPAIAAKAAFAKPVAAGIYGSFFVGRVAKEPTARLRGEKAGRLLVKETLPIIAGTYIGGGGLERDLEKFIQVRPIQGGTGILFKKPGEPFVAQLTTPSGKVIKILGISKSALTQMYGTLPVTYTPPLPKDLMVYPKGSELLAYKYEPVGVFAKELPVYTSPSYYKQVIKEMKPIELTSKQLMKQFRKEVIGKYSISPMKIEPVGVFAKELPIYQSPKYYKQKSLEEWRATALSEFKTGQRPLTSLPKELRKSIRKTFTEESRWFYEMRGMKQPKDLLVDINKIAPPVTKQIIKPFEYLKPTKQPIKDIRLDIYKELPTKTGQVLLLKPQIAKPVIELKPIVQPKLDTIQKALQIPKSKAVQKPKAITALGQPLFTDLDKLVGAGSIGKTSISIGLFPLTKTIPKTTIKTEQILKQIAKPKLKIIQIPKQKLLKPQIAKPVIELKPIVQPKLDTIQKALQIPKITKPVIELKPIVQPKLDTIQKALQIPKITAIPKIGTIPMIRTLPKIQTLPKYIPKIEYIQRLDQFIGTPRLLKQSGTKITQLKFPKPKSFISTKRKKALKIKRKTKYQPSLVAVEKKVFGKKPKILTGIDIRPLIRI